MSARSYVCKHCQLELNLLRRKLGLCRECNRINCNEKQIKYKPSGHYVYFWKDDRKIFYIGCGQGFRCWHSHGSQRCQWIKDFDCVKFRFEIIHEGMEKKSAIALERLLIETYEPIGNLQYLDPNRPFSMKGNPKASKKYADKFKGERLPF